jgi:hypothetical protein
MAVRKLMSIISHSRKSPIIQFAFRMKKFLRILFISIAGNDCFSKLRSKSINKSDPALTPLKPQFELYSANFITARYEQEKKGNRPNPTESPTRHIV